MAKSRRYRLFRGLVACGGCPIVWKTLSPWARRSQGHKTCCYPAIWLETEYDWDQ
ncbi:hypothetical protein HYPGJ_31881 [Hyphomicrobium sp. GJ21]|nr:hypothetical protein HYPGJ_31881 [Hyphomicrobium sp. GJ21]